MISLIECKNYRCLKYIKQELNNFQILIGPNASGKTTLLDVVGFIADIIKEGIDAAISKRSSNYIDLTFAGQGGNIELAIEVALPNDIREKLGDTDFVTIRYEIKIGLDDVTYEHIIKEERVLLLKSNTKFTLNLKGVTKSLFPENAIAPTTILNQNYTIKGSSRPVIKKKEKGNDNFYIETTTEYNRSGGWLPSFKFGPKRSALGNLPADETKFPASTWLKDFLSDGIQIFVLDSLNIRNASPPGQVKKFKPDGSNLPWVIEELYKRPERYDKWIKHLKTALPDIETIDTRERQDDKHRYLRVHYANDIVVPSWLVSDGTLRLLALTLPAYLQDFKGVYLIEEPENGIHPKAIESVYQSLSSVYNAQILMASHSTVFLSLIHLNDILCFAKTKDGITDIVKGINHPFLKDWQGKVNLSELFAGGILG